MKKLVFDANQISMMVSRSLPNLPNQYFIADAVDEDTGEVYTLAWGTEYMKMDADPTFVFDEQKQDVTANDCYEFIPSYDQSIFQRTAEIGAIGRYMLVRAYTDGITVIGKYKFKAAAHKAMLEDMRMCYETQIAKEVESQITVNDEDVKDNTSDYISYSRACYHYWGKDLEVAYWQIIDLYADNN